MTLARETGQYDCVLGPLDVYLRNCGLELGRTWDVILTIRRHATASELLLSGYCVPFDAVVDGQTVPVSAEAAWAAERKRNHLPSAVLHDRIVDGSRDEAAAEENLGLRRVSVVRGYGNAEKVTSTIRAIRDGG